jgi:hypothetical protein
VRTVNPRDGVSDGECVGSLTSKELQVFVGAHIGGVEIEAVGQSFRGFSCDRTGFAGAEIPWTHSRSAASFSVSVKTRDFYWIPGGLWRVCRWFIENVVGVSVAVTGFGAQYFYRPSVAPDVVCVRFGG